jgi:hypothetical protein
VGFSYSYIEINILGCSACMTDCPEFESDIFPADGGLSAPEFMSTKS